VESPDPVTYSGSPGEKSVPRRGCWQRLPLVKDTFRIAEGVALSRVPPAAADRGTLCVVLCAGLSRLFGLDVGDQRLRGQNDAEYAGSISSGISTEPTGV
jgi:hypothetical protein